MTKVAILKRKIIHAYNNPKNWEYSQFKGYVGYFGYSSLEEAIKITVSDFKEYYGPTLKKWRYMRVKIHPLKRLKSLKYKY